MRPQKVAPDETLVSFDVSSLFTNITIPVALEVINRNLQNTLTTQEYKTFWHILLSYLETKLSPFWN